MAVVVVSVRFSITVVVVSVRAVVVVVSVSAFVVVIVVSCAHASPLPLIISKPLKTGGGSCN